MSLATSAGKASPTFDLGTAGKIISGLVGGGVLGQIARYCRQRSWPQRSLAMGVSAALSPRRLLVQLRTKLWPDDQLNKFDLSSN
jgi:hypothetical protein